MFDTTIPELDDNGKQRIYIIESEAGLAKIGVSLNVEARLRELQTAHPFDLSIAHTRENPNFSARLIEQAAHRILHTKRIKGEWFKVSTEEAISAIDSAEAVLSLYRSYIYKINNVNTYENRSTNSDYEDIARNTMSKFVTEHLVRSKSAAVLASDVYEAFKVYWPKDVGELPSQTSFGIVVRNSGIMKDKRLGKIMYVDVSLGKNRSIGRSIAA